MQYRFADHSYSDQLINSSGIFSGDPSGRHEHWYLDLEEMQSALDQGYSILEIDDTGEVVGFVLIVLSESINKPQLIIEHPRIRASENADPNSYTPESLIRYSNIVRQAVRTHQEYYHLDLSALFPGLIESAGSNAFGGVLQHRGGSNRVVRVGRVGDEELLDKSLIYVENIDAYKQNFRKLMSEGNSVVEVLNGTILTGWITAHKTKKPDNWTPHALKDSDNYDSFLTIEDVVLQDVHYRHSKAYWMLARKARNLELVGLFKKTATKNSVSLNPSNDYYAY